MSSKQRLSASVDADLIQAAEDAVARGRFVSVSAWVNEALRFKLAHERRVEALAAFVARYEREHGEILASRRAQREFMKLRGKVKLRADFARLRQDR
jgi:Arc/MetJ-type ribon-helix-helix transcriptional regulator